MSTNTTIEKNMQEETKAKEPELATVPAEVENEEKHAIVIRGEMLQRLAAEGVERVQAYMKGLETLQAAAINATHAFDWTLYKDRDGRVIGVPRAEGCKTIRRWMGISILDVSDPYVYHEQGSHGQRVICVKQRANGHCALTQEFQPKIEFEVRSDDDFVGRKVPGGKEARIQDLKSSCRTGLDSKITRILSGLGKVPAQKLEEFGIDLNIAHKGMGFGTSSDREASRVAEEGVKEAAKKLGVEIMKRVGGDKEAAKQVLVDITKSDDGKKFKGFTSVDRMTQKWQVDNAWEKLRMHEMFGDREPGGDDDRGEAQGRLV